MNAALTADDMKQLEETHPEGLSVSAVVDILRERGVMLAEATFRKYVQLGLLPRSRRVGRKGKHRGSHGLYPVAVVRRIVEIRQLMDGGLTLEELQRSSIAYANDIDAVRIASESVLAKLEDEARSRAQRTAASLRRLTQLREQASALVVALESATEELCPVSALEKSPAPHAAERPASGRRSAILAVAGRRGRGPRLQDAKE